MHARRPLVAILLSLATSAHARTIAHVSTDEHPPPEPRPAEPRPAEPQRDAAIGVALLDGHPAVHFAHAAVVAHDTGDAGVITLALTLATTEYAQVGYVDIQLPADARIVGLVFDRGGASITAEPRATLEARRGFAEAVARRIDPVLLEQSEHGHARLAIFPISAAEPVTARLQIAMNRFDRVMVDVADQHMEATATPDPTDDDLRIAAASAAISEQQSLVAEPDGPPPTDTEIRHQFQLARPELDRCDTLRDEHSDVTIHFKIHPDGLVTGAYVEYMYLDPFEECVVAVVQAWHFAPAAGETAKLSYPIRFNRASRATVAAASLE